VGLKRDSLSLVSRTEGLLGGKSSGSGIENRDYGRKGSAALAMRHPLYAKIGTNFADKRRSSVGIVCSRNSGHGICLFV
jgi:hypothetical protein